MRSELLSAHADLELNFAIKKLYGPELQKLKHGVLSLLSRGSDEYNKRLADEITTLQHNRLSTAKALVGRLCAELDASCESDRIRHQTSGIVMNNC